MVLHRQDPIPPKRDARYVETHPDISHWARVSFCELFNRQRIYEGFLYDLTHRAVRILLDRAHEGDLRYGVGRPAIVTFRLNGTGSVKTISTATVKRLDAGRDRVQNFPNHFAVVLFFDIMREPERQALQEVCEIFERSGKSPRLSADASSGATHSPQVAAHTRKNPG